MFDDLTEPAITTPIPILLWQAGRLTLWLRLEAGERAAVLLEGDQLRGLWLLPRRARPS
jgi:hypothetical protein